LVEDLRRRRRGWRLLGYLLVGVASFFSSLAPLTQTIVQAIGMVIIHAFVIRRSLKWLPPLRRITCRFSIQLMAALIVSTVFVINVAVAPFLGVSAVVLAIVGFVAALLHGESALWMIQRRLTWAAEARPVQAREWMLPVGLGGGLFGFVFASIGVAIGALHLLVSLKVPGVSAIAEWLLNSSLQGWT